MAAIELCKPATILVLVSVAGAIYHLLSGNGRGIIWWLVVGVLGGSVFQGLCVGGMDTVAWVLMGIPVLLVCFFLAIALFSSGIRIQERTRPQPVDPCNRCRRPEPECECDRGGCTGDFCH